MAHPQRRLSAWEHFVDGTWTSYMAAGTAAIVLSWVLTGCRIGNRVEQNNGSTADTISGFYSTSPQTMEACVMKNGATDPNCTSLSTNSAPQALKDLMTDPVAVLLRDASSRTAHIFSPFATPDEEGSIPSFMVTADLSRRTLTREKQVAPVALWFDAACQETGLTVINAAMNTQGAGSSVGGFKISGRIQLKFESYVWLEGSCAATTQAIADCLADVTKCRQTDAQENQVAQDFWRDYYGPYIDAGLIAAADIPTVKTLGYGIVYR
jgi:hypothetical protein